MGKLIGTIGAGCALLFVSSAALAESQPHMEATLGALENARAEIEAAAASHSHGGHAEAAARLIREAIHEVKEGIRFRDEHGRR